MAKHAAIFAKLKKDRYTVQVDGAPGGVNASILDGDDVVESFTAEDMAAVEHEIGSAGFEFPVATVKPLSGKWEAKVTPKGRSRVMQITRG